VKYAFRQANGDEFELKGMCRVLEVSRSGTTTGVGVKTPSATNKIAFCSRRFARSTRIPRRPMVPPRPGRC
jgi:hypothetical protein